jgi:hypothetical protein
VGKAAQNNPTSNLDPPFGDRCHGMAPFMVLF